MGLILDTCVFIHAERVKGSIDLKNLPETSNYISAITASELLIGVYRANTEKRRLKRSAFIEAILTDIPILDFTTEIARLHAELYAYLAKKGQLIGAHDLIIGSTALAHGCAILTSNGKEFERIPGLKVFKLGTEAPTA